MNGQDRKDEILAQKLLEFVDSQKYKNLVVADMPDLQDNNQSLGIEVVCANYEEQKEAENCIHKNINCQIYGEKCKYTEEKIKYILQKNNLIPFSINDEICGYSCPLHFKEAENILLKQVERKHFKLSTYKYCKSYELFVFDQTDCFNENTFHNRNEKILKKYKELLENQKLSEDGNKRIDALDYEEKILRYFNRIIIFRFGYKLIDVLDIADSIVIKIFNVAKFLDVSDIQTVKNMI